LQGRSAWPSVLLVNPQVLSSIPDVSRRRSQRVLLSMPVLVQGEAEGAQSILEETETLVVNTHGALIALAMKVEFHQPLLLKNQRSQEEQPCRVVYLGPPAGGKKQVGVEFTRPAPHFWHFAFLPDKWEPRPAYSGSKQSA